MNKKLWSSFTLLPIAGLSVLTIASCSSANNKEAELNQAMENTKQILENLFYQNSASNATQGRVNFLQTLVLPPHKNLGFKTKIEAVSKNETEDADDEKGTKQILITVSRVDSPTKTEQFEINGYLSTQDEKNERADADIQVGQLLNWNPGHQIKLKTIDPTLTAREARHLLAADMSEETLAKIIKIEPTKDSIPDSLFKVKKPSATKVSIENVRLEKQGHMENNALDVIIKLEKNNLKSRYIQIYIDGFANDKTYETQANLIDWAHVFATIHNPLQPSLDGKPIPKATDIKKLADLLPFLAKGYQNFGNLNVQFIDQISNQNGQLGSIDIPIKIRYKDKPDNEIQQETIRLFGFAENN